MEIVKAATTKRRVLVEKSWLLKLFPSVVALHAEPSLSLGGEGNEQMH